MKIEIDLDERATQYLSPQARRSLKSLANKYAQNLLLEAIRLEAAGHSQRGDPEITGKNVTDAATYLKGFPNPQKRAWWFVLIQVASAITTLLVGALFDLPTVQRDATALYFFLAILVLAVVLNSAEIIIGRPQ